MFRPILVLSAATLAAAPAAAANYSAKLAAPAQGRIVARDINWVCGGGTCEGATQESRPSVLCQALAKRAGRIDAFLVDGQPFAGGELGKCNAAAKPASGNAIAAK
jgi:hypothetical protein